VGHACASDHHNGAPISSMATNRSEDLKSRSDGYFLHCCRVNVISVEAQAEEMDGDSG